MNEKSRAVEVIHAIKSLAAELGRAPSRDEFRERTGLERAVRNAFGGSYSAALHAAGFVKESFNSAGTKKAKQFKYTQQKLQGFHIKNYDLDTLFERAGNPKSLKVVAQPDTHVPFHDGPALGAFMKFCRYYGPDVHIIMGDFMDMNGISHWPASDLAPRRFVPEMKEGRKVLREIVAATSSTTSRFYLTGNHEDWLEQAKVAKLPELFDGIGDLLPEGVDLGIKTFLELDVHGFEVQPLNHLLQLGKAYFTHGLYTNDNHPKKHLETFGKNIYYAHLHDIKGYNKMSIDGPIEGQSLGCLCRLDAKFMKGRPNNWVHSFGVWEIFPDGTFTFFKPCIFNGRLSFNGKVFDGN